MSKILFFSDIHFHASHRFSHIDSNGYTIRENEHISCADTINSLIDKYDIDSVIFGGDMFQTVGDNISGQTLSAVTTFVHLIHDKCIEKSINFEMLVGNHDTCGHLNNIYSHKLHAFKYWSNINVYDQPTVIGNNIYMPYCISDEYATAFLEKIENKNEKYVFSHLEIKGINLGHGIFTQKGIEIELLKQFKRVFQGHYHSGGKYGKNIHLVGSTQRLSFKDPGIARNNIFIYDTEKDTIKKESFSCPDWLFFTDDNIDNILLISDDNYVKLDLSTDILITPEIEKKLSSVKNKDIHIDITRISLNNATSTPSLKNEDEIVVLKQFIDNSNNTEDQKKLLVEESIDLVNRSR